MVKESNYEKLDELKEIEWVQHVPETFIGTTDHPTHLFEEVFDNSLDEVLSGSAKTIVIKIDGNGCMIKDDGRGIPTKNNKDGIPYPVRACTKLYTSGKFNKGVDAYKMSAGLNGIGLVAVCALSDNMKIISYRDGLAHEYQFTTSFKTHDIKHVIKESTKSIEQGTYISFKPSKEIFRLTTFDNEYIKERVQIAKLLTDANISLYIDNQEVMIEADKDKLLDTFFSVGPEDTRHIVDVEVDGEVVKISFFYDFIKNEPRFKGSVNLLPVHSGAHIKYAKGIVAKTLQPLMPKNKLLNKNDYLIGIRCFIETNIENVRFNGQIKDSLAIDVKRFEKFDEALTKALTKVFKEEVDLDALYQRLITYKQGLDLKKSAKKVRRRKFSPNLFDSMKYGQGTSLFIVEGESAAGSLVQSRDKNKHAIYTLVGKRMPNVDNISPSKVVKILSNTTVADLFNVMGKNHDINPIDDVANVRYEYIVITTDPDIDGYHISIMVMKFLNRFFPQLIELGRVWLAQIPLYGYMDKGSFTPIYDNKEAKILMESKHLTRYKGLGEFDPDELEVVLFKKSKYIVLTKSEIEKHIGEDETEPEEVEEVDTIINIDTTPTLSDIVSEDEDDELFPLGDFKF